MKRLLLGPAVLVLPLLTLGFCGKPQLPKVVPEVVREIPTPDTFEQRFPPITTMPTPEPHKTPVVKHRPNQVKPHVDLRPPTVRAPAHRAPARPSHVAPLATPDAGAPLDVLPPQQGAICIFPLNMIPNCTPQAIVQ
jgi:hypothetical protein